MISTLKLFVLASALLCMANARPTFDIDDPFDQITSNREGRQNPISNILNNLPGPLNPQSPHNPVNIIGNLLGRTTTKAPEDGEPTTVTTRRPFLGGIFNGILNRPNAPDANGQTTTRRSIIGGIMNIFNPSTAAPVKLTTSIIDNVEVTRPTLPSLNIISEYFSQGITSPPRAPTTPFALLPALPTNPSAPIAAPSFMNRIVQIFQQVQNGFTNTLGGLLHLPRNDVPVNVRESTDTIMKYAEVNNIDFQPVLTQLPFLAVMSPQRQFESILRIIRPKDGAVEGDFFQATNTVLDYLSNPKFSNSLRERFYSNFPSIHKHLEDMWINVSQFMASYNFTPVQNNNEGAIPPRDPVEIVDEEV